MNVLSAGIVPVSDTQRGWMYLLLRSFNYWDFPKGEVEPSEDPFQAALRELQEETGIKDGESVWGKKYLETEKYSRGKVARYYILKVEMPEKIIFDPNPETGIIEHHEYRWVRYHDAQKLLGPRVNKILDWAQSTIDHAK
jgi:8-oxo-dGTP pyrophosphatase MutT (NUDIX family)